MAAALNHALLAAAVAALAGAALRAAALATPDGGERALAATVLAAAAAILEATLLGLIGLGGSAVALSLAAVATWGAARAALPRPDRSVSSLLAGWVRRSRTAELAVVAGLVGVVAAWTAWMLRYPGLGYDSVLYHLPEAIAWVHGGSPGSVEPIVVGLPVGSYPLAYEVLASWALAIDRSLVPVLFLTAGFATLLAGSTWLLLRRLELPGTVAALAAAALTLSPAVIAQGANGATLDGAALAWLSTCAALVAASRRRPALLAPALVAGGLAAGTKTTALPLTVVVLAVGLWLGREHLGRLARPLAAAGVAALAVGATWYLRNLIDHGSPFWPYLTLPWGDPAPRAIRIADISFLDRPGETLRRLDRHYLERFAGGIVLLVGAAVVAALSRRRGVVLAALAALASLLLWLNAPLTGVSDEPGFDPGTGDATRYLLPGLGAATLALALAAARIGPARLPALGLLALAGALNLIQALDLGFPSMPRASTLAAGALAGAIAGLALARLRGLRDPRWSPLVARAAAVAVAALVVIALTPAVDGLGERHAGANLFDAGVVSWLHSQRAFEDGEQPVAVTGTLNALFAGDRLEHRQRLLPITGPCAEVERARHEGWVVFTRLVKPPPDDVSRCLPASEADYADESHRVYAPR